jgi:hypothetical protein
MASSIDTVTHSALSVNRELCIFVLLLMERCAVGSSLWVLVITSPLLLLIHICML